MCALWGHHRGHHLRLARASRTPVREPRSRARPRALYVYSHGQTMHDAQVVRAHRRRTGPHPLPCWSSIVVLSTYPLHISATSNTSSTNATCGSDRPYLTVSFMRGQVMVNRLFIMRVDLPSAADCAHGCDLHLGACAACVCDRHHPQRRPHTNVRLH